MIPEYWIESEMIQSNSSDQSWNIFFGFHSFWIILEYFRTQIWLITNLITSKMCEFPIFFHIFPIDSTELFVVRRWRPLPIDPRLQSAPGLDQHSLGLGDHKASRVLLVYLSIDLYRSIYHISHIITSCCSINKAYFFLAYLCIYSRLYSDLWHMKTKKSWIL